MYWDMVLKEVLNKDSPKQNFLFTNVAEFRNRNIAKDRLKAMADKKLKREMTLKKYFLGTQFKDIYFTRREAECMVMLLKGKTINAAALKLGLSPRTVEFYLKNMKVKIGCCTKFELIELVIATDFLRNIDFKI
jgi:DNA-binding CsgD family transcriptional regulator